MIITFQTNSEMYNQTLKNENLLGIKNRRQLNYLPLEWGYTHLIHTYIISKWPTPVWDVCKRKPVKCQSIIQTSIPLPLAK